MINQLGMPQACSPIEREKQFSIFKCENGFVLVTDHGNRSTIHSNKTDVVDAIVSILEKSFTEVKN